MGKVGGEEQKEEKCKGTRTSGKELPQVSQFMKYKTNA